MPVYTLKHGVVTFTTGASTKSLALSPGEGNFTLSAVQAGNKAAINVFNRGTFYERVDGAEEPITGTITVLMDGAHTAAGSARLMDAVRGTGYYAGETTDDPGGIVWSGLVTIVHTRVAAVQTITLANVRLRADFAEGAEGNTFTISFEACGNGSGDALAMSSA